MTLLQQTSAPFIITLLIAAVGWLFDKSIAQFETTAFLYYGVRPEQGHDSTIRLVIKNNSLSKTLQNVLFVVECESASDCFNERPNATPENRFGSYVAVPPNRLSVTFDDDTNPKYSQVRITSVPPTATLHFRYYTDVEASKFAVSFSFPTTPGELVAVYTGVSLAAFIANNYYKILFALLIALVLLFAGFIISSLRKKPEEKTYDATYRVVVLLDDPPPAERGPGG
jgi:hypothetical protein